MKKICFTIPAVLVAASLTGCSYFSFQGVKYRTGAAHSSSIGSVGLLRSELNNVYEPQLTPDWKAIEIAKVAEYSSTNTSNIEADAGAELSESKNVGGGLKGNKTETAIRYIFELKDKDGLLQQINSNQSLVRKLKSDKDWRIVTSSVNIFSHKLSKSIEANASAKWTMDGTGGSGISIKASVSGSTTFEMQISDGTIVGYQYSRVCWGVKSGEAELLLIDRPGADVSCLEGMTHDPSKIES